MSLNHSQKTQIPPANLDLSSPKLQKLALYGGKPVRTKILPYSKQSIDQSDIDSVTEALRGEIITRGPFVQKFESAIADYCEMPHAIAFSSATAALHAVMSCIGVKAGERVITTPNTFAATSNAVLYCNGEVDFQDVEVSTLNLDVSKLKHLEGAKAVVAVDFAGNPCDYESLLKLQKKNGFRLIADAAHSLGGSYQKKKVGSLADFSIFSFHPVKSMTTAEGGLVVARDPEEARYLREFREHGLVRTDGIPGFYRQEMLAYNYAMTDLQAALGLSQLQRLDTFIATRNEWAERYLERFKKHPFLRLPELTKGAYSAWHLFPVRIALDKLKVNRTEFLRALKAEGIGANVHYIPVYWHPYYQRLGFQKGLCPVAEQGYREEISLPVFYEMKKQDFEDVANALEKLFDAFSL